ncbi:MAG: GNAT family N-acetyltransferase [Microlunatus sp.]
MPISVPVDALAQVLPGSTVGLFEPGDLAELLVLQRCCWVSEAIINSTFDVPPLHETHDEVLAWATGWTTVVVRLQGRLVAAVRGRQEGTHWEIGRLMVAPDLAGRGVGSTLLSLIESLAPDGVSDFTLFTGAKSVRNIALYERAGYRLSASDPGSPGHIQGAVHLTKPRTVAAA